MYYYNSQVDCITTLLGNNVPAVVVLCALVVIAYPLFVKGAEDPTSDILKIATMLAVVYTSQINPTIGIAVVLVYISLTVSNPRKSRGSKEEFGNSGILSVPPRPPIMEYTGFQIPNGYFDHNHRQETFHHHSGSGNNNVLYDPEILSAASSSFSDPIPSDGVPGQYAMF